MPATPTPATPATFITIEVATKDHDVDLRKFDRVAVCACGEQFPFRAASTSGVIKPAVGEHIYEEHTDKLGFLEREAKAAEAAAKAAEKAAKAAAKTEAKAESKADAPAANKGA